MQVSPAGIERFTARALKIKFGLLCDASITKKCQHGVIQKVECGNE
ncbi:hypothetical protein ABENE_22070 [Asticcacaulis benevestitus DSM 16100 = ATCC BAA-896]|uniref:Uncharacterized protein n=1 Tax=Asticcacaulis benevestitus DSM 16100 = ATCC BAA-896 TaxID=1121022 RepID=V4P834_9CAUL|nr:hypothetical protein ABENE_22070 [Asticcacaulis benevestitus DSM 16100 = ATCC BAA-896]